MGHQNHKGKVQSYSLLHEYPSFATTSLKLRSHQYNASLKPVRRILRRLGIFVNSHMSNQLVISHSFDSLSLINTIRSSQQLHSYQYKFFFDFRSTCHHHDTFCGNRKYLYHLIATLQTRCCLSSIQVDILKLLLRARNLLFLYIHSGGCYDGVYKQHLQTMRQQLKVPFT